MTKTLTLGISTCPNDTFIFDAWINGKLRHVPPVNCFLKDISELNRMAAAQTVDVIKVSFFAYGLLRDKYRLLNAGGALGRGCGPILVAAIDVPGLDKKNMSVALPGELTTANLLFSLCYPDLKNKVYLRFDEIMPAVADKRVDAGVVIHEGRFTYQNYGLEMVKDLGAWWEQETGAPIPLGAIVARKDLGEEMFRLIEAAIRKSLEAARLNPDGALPFMRKFAGEMDDIVIRQHVDLYVNEFTRDLGEAGRHAVNVLFDRAEQEGLFLPGAKR